MVLNYILVGCPCSQTDAKPACIFPRLVTGTTVSQSVIYSTYQELDQKTSIDAVPVTACRLAIGYYSMLCPAVVGFGENFEEFWILESGFSLRGSQWKRAKLAIHCFGNSTMQSMQQTLYITHKMTAWDSSIIPSL